MVKSFDLTDIIVLVSCSLSLFTHYIRLLIRWSVVRDPADSPLFTNTFSNLSEVFDYFGDFFSVK